jgi:DNA-binding response OmpR family regulator
MTIMKRFTILITDDDERILSYLGARLRAAGYNILTATDGLQALEQIRSKELDLVILDLMMPQMDGLETLREMRAFSSAPVIFLTAKGGDEDKIRGLRLGADDYLAKPFNPDELVARIEAVRRRVEPADRRKTLGIFTQGNVVIDFNKRIVTVDGAERNLTRIEWMLLTELVQSLGRFMTYEELLTRVWGREYRGDVQLLRTWISRLRGKLEEDTTNPKLIHTIPKAGYIIHHPAGESAEPSRA